MNLNILVFALSSFKVSSPRMVKHGNVLEDQNYRNGLEATLPCATSLCDDDKDDKDKNKRTCIFKAITQ